MELLNTFTVGLPVDRTWQVLTDAERVIPCLPGAVLLSTDGDTFDGAIKVKLGPVALRYTGTGKFLDKNTENHSVVIQGNGKDAHGQGTVSVTITLTLTAVGTGTRAEVVTDLALSGRAAQFGRGVIADVSGKLLAQFVSNLETAVSDANKTEPGVAEQRPTLDDVEPLDLAGTMGGVAAKYLLPVGGVIVAVTAGVIVARFRSRSRRRPEVLPNIASIGRSGLGGVPRTFSAVVTLVPLEYSE